MDGDFEKIVEGVSRLSLHLFAQLFKGTPTSFIFSPLSTSKAMAAFLELASKPTSHVLNSNNISKNEMKIIRSDAQLVKRLCFDANSNYIRCPSYLFVDDSITIPNETVEELEHVFGVNVMSINFSKPTIAVESINTAIASATKGHILKVVETVKKANKYLAVDVLYFKGIWKDGFDPIHNIFEDFHLASGEQVRVPYMYSFGDFETGYSAHFHSWIIRFPYAESNLSLFILLPKVGRKVDVFANGSKDEKSFRTLFNGTLIEKKQLHVLLPKFRVKSDQSLMDGLLSFGIRDIFSENGSPEARLQDFLQKAELDVEEDGLNSTIVSPEVIPCIQEFKAFRINRPFAFAVVSNLEEKHNVCLFMGLIRDPKEGLDECDFHVD